MPDAKREKIVWLWQNFNIKMQFKTETEEKEEAKFQKSAKYLLLHTHNLLSIGEKRNFEQQEFNFRIRFNPNQTICARKVCWMVVHY